MPLDFNPIKSWFNMEIKNLKLLEKLGMEIQFIYIDENVMFIDWLTDVFVIKKSLRVYVHLFKYLPLIYKIEL